MGKDRAELVVRATDSGNVLRFRVETINIVVNHAFGENARYKGRSEELTLEITPENLAFDIQSPDGFDDAQPDKVLAAILGPVVYGCEIVVREALAREKEVKDKRLEQVGKQKAKLFNQYQ